MGTAHSYYCRENSLQHSIGLEENVRFEGYPIRMFLNILEFSDGYCAS